MKIEGFDPVPNPESVCPKGGGHEYVEEYVDSKVQVLKCIKCGRESVGYFFQRDEEEK